MMSMIALCALLLSNTVSQSHAEQLAAAGNLWIPLSNAVTQPGIQVLPIVEKTGAARGNTNARCSITTRREYDGSVTMEVQTLDDNRKGFSHYGQTFAIPSVEYPLKATFSTLDRDDHKMLISATYDGAIFEGGEVGDDGSSPLVSYEVVVDPFLRFVKRVTITEYDRSTKDKAHETSSITCEPAMG